MPDIYQHQIISRSQRPEFGGKLESPSHKAVGSNLSCGDEVSWELLVTEGVITDIKHQCRACAVCTASADLLAESLKSQPVATIEHTTSQAIENLLGIPLSPIRLKCALLPLEVLTNSLKPL